MFTIKCVGSELQQKLKNPEEFYPSEVCQELNQFLEILKQNGSCSKTDFYDVNTNRISAITFNLYYRSDFAKKEVLVINLKMKPADVFRQRFKIEDHWNDKEVVDSIPQYDKPAKIVRAIELIYGGITDSYQLGYELGHRGKKEKYISRHGQYAKHTLEQLKLIRRTQQGRQWLIEITEKGRFIAEALNSELKYRLLVEAMLGYQPVWEIILAVTDREGELNNESVLDDALIKTLAFPEILQGADTSNRRAQTLKNWIKWISKYSGIPIRLCPSGVQLPIPMIYADPGQNRSEDQDFEE